ncbi:MAG TPA: RHS repeat-associated core domain-containing protein [Promineifilum sp.]|nr:RHS repeat-associated core domain-containing protein [Promineifilum sp.]
MARWATAPAAAARPRDAAVVDLRDLAGVEPDGQPVRQREQALRLLADRAAGVLVRLAGHRAYYYDAFDRLESANVDGAVTGYVVNALDQRMAKTGPLGSHRYVYAGQNTLLGEHGAGGWKNYLYLAGAPVAVVTPGNEVHFIHTDHLGRPESATRADKARSWSAVNLSYHRTVAMDTIGGISLGFPGQTWDEETGTWHNGFRDYDPHTGRYIQSDPIGLAGGANTYAYVGGKSG